MIALILTAVIGGIASGAAGAIISHWWHGHQLMTAQPTPGYGQTAVVGCIWPIVAVILIGTYVFGGGRR